MKKAITWDELADVYARETGGKARIQPMEKIFDWAVGRKDIFKLNKDGTLSLKEKR